MMTKKTNGRTWLLVFMTFIFASCNRNSLFVGLMKQIPQNADFVAVGNVKILIESADGSIEDSKVKLPSFLLNELPSDAINELDELNSFLRKSGINIDACALFGDYANGHPVFVFSLNDKLLFINQIEKNGFREKDEDNGVVYYTKKVYESSLDSDYDDYGYIAVCDDYAYWIDRVWVGSSFKPMKVLAQYIENAQDSPFSETDFCRYMNSGNAIGAAFRIPQELRKHLRNEGTPSEIVERYEGVICLSGDLNETASIRATWFSEDGKVKNIDEFGSCFNINAKINPDALAYLGKDESLVMAVSMKDVNWDDFFDPIVNMSGFSRSDKASISVLKGFLERLDGTLAIGMGFTNGFESICDLNTGKDIMEQYSFTAVAELKPKKGHGFVEDLKGLLESGRIPFRETSNGFVLEVPETGGSVRLEANERFLVFSNRSIRRSDSNLIKSTFDFSKYFFAATCFLEKQNKLLKDLNINNDIAMSCYYDTGKSEMTFELKADDGKTENIIATVIKMMIKIYDQREEITRKMNRSMEYNYDPAVQDDEVEVDSVAVDSVALDEEW